MSPWYQLLLLNMAQGKYLNLSPRLKTQDDWIILWGLIQQEQARVVE